MPRSFDPTRRDRSAPAGGNGSRAGGPSSAVLRLQHAAGNRAVSELLSERSLGRQPARTPPMPLEARGPKTAPAPGALLTPEDRELLAKQARDRIGAAFTAFSSAVTDHRAALKAEDKAQAEIVAAVVEIFFGFTAPMFAAGLMSASRISQKVATKVAGVLTVKDKAAKARAVAAAAENAQIAASRAKAAAEASMKARRAAESAERARSAKEAAARIKTSTTANTLGGINPKNTKAIKEAQAAVGPATTKAQAAQDAAKRAQEAEQRATANAAAAAAAHKSAIDAATPAAVKLISETDVLKEAWKSVGSVSKVAIKLNPTVLFGESDVDVFARQLLAEFHKGVNLIRDDLAREGIRGNRSQRTDEELLALWAAYDDEFTNAPAYAKALEKTFGQFKEFVRPIEETFYNDQLGRWRNRVRGVWIVGFGRRPRLALVVDQAIAGSDWRDTSMVKGDRSPRHWFKSWVPPDMETFVVEKTVREYGQIATIEPGVLRNHVPPPPGYLDELAPERAPAPPPAPVRDPARQRAVEGGRHSA